MLLLFFGQSDTSAPPIPVIIPVVEYVDVSDVQKNFIYVTELDNFNAGGYNVATASTSPIDINKNSVYSSQTQKSGVSISET